jgi:hypothetical protein
MEYLVMQDLIQVFKQQHGGSGFGCAGRTFRI